MYGKSACTVLGGTGVQLEYGRNIVAPSRKQTANRENQLLPKFRESPVYSQSMPKQMSYSTSTRLFS